MENINLNNNQITSLPDEICNLNSDINISLTENAICLRDNVPNCFEEKIKNQTKCYSEIDLDGIQSIIDSNNVSLDICECDLNLDGIIQPFEFGQKTWETWTENARLIEATFSDINYFPKITFDYLTSIEKLNLADNNIDTIFNEIEKLINLKELDISNNKLVSIPETISNLEKLRKLKVNGNDSLIYLPELYQLNELNISHTNLFCENDIYDEEYLNNYLAYDIIVYGAFMQYCVMKPDINFLEDMVEVNELFSTWSNIGEQIWHDGRLTSFSLRNEININEIPISIANLTEISYFEISNSILNDVPIEIGELTSLNSLVLNNNNLDEIPFDFSHLHSLHLLDISSNDLNEFPESICQIQLIEVNFEDNRICDNLNPPCSIFQWNEQIQTQRCKNLEDINFILELKNQNNLEGDYSTIGLQVWSEIENEELDRLIFFEYIGIQDTNSIIYNIPTEISNVVYLEELNVINHSLENIPFEIFSLPELVSLNLSSNFINNFSITNNQNYSLLNIDLSHNELINLPNEIINLTQLKNLDISYNFIQELPLAVGNLNQINNLNISNNNFTKIPNIIENLTSLTTLNISSNNIDSIPDSWCNQLSLDWNNLNNFNSDDNKLCDQSKIPTCITVNEINQNCD